MPAASEPRACRVLGVSRSSVRPRPERPLRSPMVDQLLALRIREVIRAHPTFGYRRIWALLRFREGVEVNRKAVYRVLKLKGWFVHQRRVTPRARVRGKRSEARRSNDRWAMDVTHIPCGRDGWAHLAVSGIGAGLYDRLRERGYSVVEFMSQRRADDETDAQRHVNARSAAYWRLRNLLRDGKLALPMDEGLREELLAHHFFEAPDGRLQLVAKDDVRLAIGRSPDKSDALAMSVYRTEAAFSYGGAMVTF